MSNKYLGRPKVSQPNSFEERIKRKIECLELIDNGADSRLAWLEKKVQELQAAVTAIQDEKGKADDR